MEVVPAMGIRLPLSYSLSDSHLRFGLGLKNALVSSLAVNMDPGEQGSSTLKAAVMSPGVTPAIRPCRIHGYPW